MTSKKIKKGREQISKRISFLWPLLFSFVFIALILVAIIYGSKMFLIATSSASLLSPQNIRVILTRTALIPLFALVFAFFSVLHSWLGSSSERHNKNFLLFKFFFFFIVIMITESFLRIGESTLYAFFAGSLQIKDSLFGLDMGWYLFGIPLVKNISIFFTGYFILLFIFRISYIGDQKKIAYGKISLCLFSLFSIVLLLIFYSQFLSEKRTSGADPFLGYSDIFGHIIPLALSLMWTWLYLVVSLYFLRRRYRLLFTGAMLSFLVLLLCNVVWPFYLNKFVLAPNKLVYQNKYASIYADNTRKAFGLDRLTKNTKPKFSSKEEQLYILDPTITLTQMNAVQNISSRFYYENIFPWGASGKSLYIAPLGLKKDTNDWENTYFQHIHGYGAAMVSASQVETNGAPRYSVAGLDEKDFPLDHPEIFFDDLFENFVFINTKAPLPDYRSPKAPLSPREFPGVSGAKLNFFLRVALAFSQKDMRFLFTKYYTKQTRLIYVRKPSQLVKDILPYFDYSAPQLVYHERELWWVLDGYYSSQDVFIAASVDTPWGKRNWLRAPVRAYVNAYSGEVLFNRVDKEDPIVKILQKIYPQLFVREKEIDHLFYPKYLFQVQSALLKTFHEYNGDKFYGRQTEREFSGSIQQSLIAQEDDFIPILSQDYRNLKGRNFTARFYASLNPQGRPSISLYEDERQDLGYAQAESSLKVSETYQKLLSTWPDKNTTTLFGALSSYPDSQGISYLQPLYTNSVLLNMPILAHIFVIRKDGVQVLGRMQQISSQVQQQDSDPDLFSSFLSGAKQSEESSFQEAYLLYLEAEKERVLGNTQGYQKNVDKIGEILRQALN